MSIGNAKVFVAVLKKINGIFDPFLTSLDFRPVAFFFKKDSCSRADPRLFPFPDSV